MHATVTLTVSGARPIEMEVLPGCPSRLRVPNYNNIVFAPRFLVELKPRDVSIGLANSRRIPVAGAVRVVLLVPGSRSFEMSVLVFDGILYSILLGLDFCVATDTSVRPAQFPDFLSRPANSNSEP